MKKRKKRVKCEVTVHSEGNGGVASLVLKVDTIRR